MTSSCGIAVARGTDVLSLATLPILDWRKAILRWRCPYAVIPKATGAEASKMGHAISAGMLPGSIIQMMAAMACGGRLHSPTRIL